MKPRSFRTAFTVSDLDRSLAFYRDLLGFEVLYDRIREGEVYEQLTGFQSVKMRLALLKDAGTDHRLELVQYLNPTSAHCDLRNNSVGAANVCYFVDDLQQEYERLSQQGVRFQSPPIEFLREGKSLGKILYLYDPDGIAICLYEQYDNP